MLFVFAYVDIFRFYRADVLDAALDGKVATTAFTVDQIFLTFTLIYILLPTLMVVLSLLLKPRVNRIVTIQVAAGTGVQGLPVMASRMASMTLMPFFRAVEM